MTLLELACAGDRAAWERIVHLYSPLVDRWCRRMPLDEGQVRCVGQDVFLTLFKNLGRFRKVEEGDGFRKWLWTLTRHEVIDELRRARNEPRCVGGSAAQKALENHPIETPESDSEVEGGGTPREEKLILLRRCFELVKADFEPRTYQAFWEVVMEEKSPGDVARSLGMKSVGAVYTARSRVMKRLRELLDTLGDDVLGT
jgi:RNA polymerase sigma-70 factor (ECF subfamily)